MEKYTPTGVRQIINVLSRKERELHEAMIACHKRQKNEHPYYEKMTDQEFKSYKVQTMREFNKRRRKIQKEIKEFREML